MNPKPLSALRKRLSECDFVTTYPARGLAVSERYRPMQAGLPEGDIVKAPLPEVLRAARLEGKPVLLWPALAHAVAMQNANNRSGPSCLRRSALAMAHLCRRHPRRFRRTWRLEYRGPGMTRMLLRRWMFRSVQDADFVVTGWGGAAAIFYRGGPNSPRVRAMGAGGDARLIRALAEEHGTLIVEHEACAQRLLDEAELFEHVPESCCDPLIEVMRMAAEIHPGFREKWDCVPKEENEGEEWKL